MYELNDTIVAVSSPTSGAKAIVRITGPKTIDILRQIFSPSISSSVCRDAYREGNYKKALSKLQSTASWLEQINPDAAASLREGMEETLAITKLKVPPDLRASLATTNPIESTFSVVRRLTHRVSNWRNGDMRHRWCATGLLIAESKFRKLRGYRDIPTLIRALQNLVGDGQIDKTKDAA